VNVCFNGEDAVQISVGAFALGVPVAFSEEAWQSAMTLPIPNLFLVVGLSLVFLGLYAYQGIFQHRIHARIWAFVLRIFIAYGLTLFVVALILISLDKFPLFSEAALALKRMLIIAMPASIGAIVVDGFDKE
jgi:uncharacterized membrane protein